jgi:hypothetical protein
LLEAKNTQKSIKELNEWKFFLIKVVKQPQKPLRGSSQQPLFYASRVEAAGYTRGHYIAAYAQLYVAAAKM